MPDDRSPALGSEGSHLTGREPVLSGVHSRALADRLGAYQAGNRRALIELMRPDQKLAFKRWCVRVAVRRARRCLPLYEAAQPGDARPRRALDAAQMWIMQPSAQTQQAAQRASTAALQAAREVITGHAPVVNWSAQAASWSAMAVVHEVGTRQWISSSGYDSLQAVRAAWLARREDALTYEAMQSGVFHPVPSILRAQMRAAYTILQRV